MARAHGFRVYVVEAFRGRKKDNEPEESSQTSVTRNEIVGLLEALHAHGTHFLEPRQPRDTGAPRRAVESVSVGEPLEYSAEFLHQVVATGEAGSHGRATRPDSDPQDLHEWSPEADHFVTFLFPRAGRRFFLIAQTIERKDTVAQLLRLLTLESLHAQQHADEKELATKRGMRAQGDRSARPEIPRRLLFERRLAVDNAYINDILSSATSASAVFEARLPSDRGSKRPLVRRTLSIRLLDEHDREIARVAGRRWAGRKRDGNSTSMAEGVSELADLLQADNLIEEGEAGEYNAASIQVQSPGGGTRIAVDTLRDVFTYPVADSQPSAYFYYDKISPRISSIASEEHLQVSFVNAREVSDWLEGLTSDRSSTA